VRSEIRLKDGRAKPIDVLSKNLNLSDDFDVEINEPYKIYKVGSMAFPSHGVFLCISMCFHGLEYIMV
jgi:hypothetical protein